MLITIVGNNKTTAYGIIFVNVMENYADMDTRRQLTAMLLALLLAGSAAAQDSVRPLPFFDDFEQYVNPYRDSVWPWQPVCYYLFNGWESCGRGITAVMPTPPLGPTYNDTMVLGMGQSTLSRPLWDWCADTIEGLGWGNLVVTPWFDTVPGVVSFDAQAIGDVEWWGVRQRDPWIFLQVGTVSGPLPDTTINYQEWIPGAGNPECGLNFVPWVTVAIPSFQSGDWSHYDWSHYRVDLHGLFEGQTPPYRVAFYSAQIDSTLYSTIPIPTNYGLVTPHAYYRSAQVWLDDVRIDPAGTVTYDTVQHVDTVCQWSYYTDHGFALDHHQTADTGTHHFEYTEVLTDDGSQQRVHMLELTVLPREISLQAVSLVRGDTLWWQGMPLTRDTVCQLVEPPVGCRLITLQLTVVLPRDTVHHYDTVYAGSAYLLHGFAIDTVAAGDPVYTLDTTVDSVETLIVLHLHAVQPHLSASRLTICEGDTVILTESGALGGLWRCRPDAPWLSSNSTTAMSLPWQTTTYIFADSNGRPLDSLTVEVFGMPTVRLSMGRDYIDFDYPVVTLEDLTEGSTWSRWEFSDGSTVTGRKVRRQFHHPLPDSLMVLLTTCNAANCCADTLLTLRTFIRAVWFPNVFTPDADINNRFGVVTNCTATVYTLTIFNRRGEVVFESKEPTTLWDGTTKGVPLPQGAYVYSWFLEDASGFRHSGVGTVTLLR